MIVVADSSPLRYLIELGEEELLPRLYKTVQIPKEVLSELENLETPPVVRDWCASAPEWLQVKAVRGRLPAEYELDLGEASAIQLALENHAGLLLVHDRGGAEAAKNLGLQVTATLGVLLAAHELGVADARSLFERLLVTTNFYRTERLKSDFARQIAKLEGQP